jgi:hypothetical protein
MLRKIGISLLVAAAGAKLYESQTESYIFTRNLRTIKCGLHILYSYKILFNEDNYLDIHESVAEDIYNSKRYITQLALKTMDCMLSLAKASPPWIISFLHHFISI